MDDELLQILTDHQLDGSRASSHGLHQHRLDQGLHDLRVLALLNHGGVQLSDNLQVQRVGNVGQILAVIGHVLH